MKTLEDFKPFYQQLLPQLHKLENIRLETLEKVARMKQVYISFTPVWLVITLIVGIVIYNSSLEDPANGVVDALVNTGIVTSLMVLGWWGWYFAMKDWLCNKWYFSRIYEFALAYIICFIDPNMRFEPDKCIHPDLYVHSSLFRKEFDGYTGQHLVYGDIGKTSIMFSELYIWYDYEDEDGDKRRSDIFKGLLMTADFHKHFKHKTTIVPVLSIKPHFAEGLGEPIEMEDQEFESEFSVYSTDPIEARYLLSTSMMQNMLRFKAKMQQPVHFSFIDDRFYIAIKNGKLVDFPAVETTLLDEATAFDIFDNVILFADIVEDLNLNTRIWSKQSA